MSTEGFCPGESVGKRVYLVYPSAQPPAEMTAELIHEEYEVYWVHDLDKVEALFHRHPDSVAFFHIDEGPPEPEWEQLVRHLQEDESLQCLQIGILTGRDDPELIQKYRMNLMVPGGVVPLNQSWRETAAQIRRVLEVNDARGRRRYLRVHCEAANSTLNLRWKDQALQGAVVDLSTAGMACTLEPDPELVSRTAIEGIQLKLKGIPCLVSGVVAGTRAGDEGLVYVVLFNERTAPDSREKIRSFLAWTLQNDLEQEVGAIV